MNTIIEGKLQRMGGVWRGSMVQCLLLLTLSLVPFSASAQVKTTVTDNLVGPDGSPATGTMTVSAAGAFQSADGHNVAQSWRIQIPVSGGSFTVNLIPNQGATPSGQNNSYIVVYNLTSSLGTSYWTETWFVPSTGPVGLAAVRTLPFFPSTFLSPQQPNTLLSGPASGGSSGPPTFRALVGTDLPLPSATSMGGVESLACSSGQFLNQISTSGAPACGTPSGGGSGNGSVTSVGLSLPSIFNVAGSPVTSSGTLAATFASQSANLFLASPNGLSGPLAPRTIVATDIPLLNQSTTGNAATASLAALATALAATPTPCAANTFAQSIAANGNLTCNSALTANAGAGHNWLSSVSAAGVFTTARPACADLSDAASTCNTLPTLAQSVSNISHKWLNSYNAATGAFTASQPASTDLSDFSTLAANTATQLASTPSLCPTGQAPTGILPNGDATGCAALGSGGSMTWPGAAGIPNYMGSSSWGTSYNATNQIPASFIPTLNQNTTGNAATATSATTAISANTATTAGGLATTPTQCAGSGQAFATGIAANGNANCSNTGFAARDVTASSDTIQATDHSRGVNFTGSAAVAETLPTATTLGVANFSTSLLNATTGSSTAVTVTPSGAWAIYPNGQSSLSESTLTIGQGQYCFLNVDPAGSAWDATCHDAPISAGAGVTVLRTASGVTVSAACGQSGVVCASDYGVTSAGSGQVFDAKFTNGAATVNSPSAQWTSAIVGAKVFGTTGPFGDEQGTYNSKLVAGSTSSTPCTVATFVDAHDITLSCNSNSDADGANDGTFTWGYDQTAALRAAASAATSGTVCQTLMLPGGDIFVNDAILPTLACLNGLFGATGTNADSGWTVSGQGLQGTQIIVTPDMKWSDCTGFNTKVSNSNGCFFAYAGVTLQNLFIQGGGYGNTGLSSNVSLLIAANDCHFTNIGVGYLGANDTHVTGINFVQSGAYCDECWVVGAGAVGVNVATNVGAGHWSNSWISQSANYDLYLNSGSQFRSVKSGFAGQNSGVYPLVFNNGATWWSTQDAFAYLSASPTIESGNALAVTYLTQPKIYNTYSSGAPVLDVAAGKVYLQEATLSSTGGKGLWVNGGTVFDLGGNQNISGSPAISYTSGTAVGDDSITGSAQASANIALTSGWGTGAAVGTVSGQTKWEEWTITPAGTPSANPVVTVTFPTSFWAPPTCNLFIVGGGTELTPPLSPTSVAVGSVSWTLTGTPSAAQTYTFVQMCNTTGVSPGNGFLTATGAPGAGNLARFLSANLLAPATSSNIVAMFGGGSCSGYLKSDGTCSTPSGGGTVTSSGYSSGNPLAAFSTSTNIIPATYSSVVNLFGSCSGTQYLGADGNCHTANGSGSVTSVTFTGDGVLDSSIPSTAVTTSGTVAATVLSQNANTVLGNCTTGNATPTFCSITSPMLPQATPSANGAMNIGVSFTYSASSTTAMGAVSTNQIRLLSFHMPYATYASHISYYVSTADNSANDYDLGLYGPGCNAGASNVPLAAHIGSTAGTTFAPNTGQKYISLASATTFTPGWYCWAVTSGASSPTANLGGTTSDSDSMFGNTTIAGGGNSLPNTITAPSISFASAGASSGPNVTLY